MKQNWRSNAAKAFVRGFCDTQTAIVERTSALLRGTNFPPTDLDAIVRSMGIKMRKEIIQGSGFLARNDNGLEIVCNPTQSPARQRFTIAHELAHALIDQIAPGFDQHNEEVEQLCNSIAAELLMPREVCIRKLRSIRNVNHDLALSHVAEIAEIFQTSLEATLYRCAEFLRVSVFIVADGGVQSVKGPLRASDALLDEGLSALIRKATDGDSGTYELYLQADASVRLYRVHYRPSQSNRALFLLTPQPSPEA